MKTCLSRLLIPLTVCLAVLGLGVGTAAAGDGVTIHMPTPASFGAPHCMLTASGYADIKVQYTGSVGHPSSSRTGVITWAASFYGCTFKPGETMPNLCVYVVDVDPVGPTSLGSERCTGFHTLDAKGNPIPTVAGQSLSPVGGGWGLASFDVPCVSRHAIHMVVYLWNTAGHLAMLPLRSIQCPAWRP